MIVHYSHWLPRLLRVGAITLGTRVYVAAPAISATLLKHESEHGRQFQELGWLRFVARYLREYLAGRLAGKSHQDAYLAISLEAQARAAALAD